MSKPKLVQIRKSSEISMRNTTGPHDRKIMTYLTN